MVTIPGGKSDYLEAAQLDEVLGGTAFTAPANTYVALFSTPVTDAGGGTEFTTGTAPAYARVQLTNNTTSWPAGNPKSNGVVITFPTATGDWPRAFGWAVYDAASAGNLLYHGPFAGVARLGSVDATDVTNNTITSPAHGFTNTTPMQVFSYQGGALPTGLSAATRYFVVGAATDTFQLSATSGGAAIDITAVGLGFLEVAQDNSIVVSNGGTASFAVSALVIQED